jgi:hypothetical protein
MILLPLLLRAELCPEDLRHSEGSSIYRPAVWRSAGPRNRRSIAPLKRPSLNKTLKLPQAAQQGRISYDLGDNSKPSSCAYRSAPPVFAPA